MNYPHLIFEKGSFKVAVSGYSSSWDSDGLFPERAGVGRIRMAHHEKHCCSFTVATLLSAHDKSKQRELL